MRISPEALEEFKQIYKKEYGKELTGAEAYESASSLLRLMKAVYKSITKADMEETLKRQAQLRGKDNSSGVK